jgi:hypothetical protein
VKTAEYQTMVEMYEGMAGVVNGSNIRVNGVYHIGENPEARFRLLRESNKRRAVNSRSASPIISLCFRKPKYNAVVYAAETSLLPSPAK